MGNCLTCFREAPTQAENNSNTHCHKEEMPEVRLYSAPSHIPAASTIIDAQSNGNHIPIPVEHCGSLSRFYPRSKQTSNRSVSTMGLTDSKPSDTKLNALFDHYRDPNEDSILAEGIERLCNDLQVQPDEFKILVLAWKLNAEQMCRFTRSEFVQGCKLMRVDSIKSIQTRLPEIVVELDQNAELFKDLYRFTFRFGLDAPIGQRILPADMAICLWKLVFTIREPPILSRWLNFLKINQHVRGIPKDTWNMFLNFSEAVGNDLSSYDDTEAWPSLFDDFVEFENDQMNQNISKDNKECESLLIHQED